MTDELDPVLARLHRYTLITDGCWLWQGTYDSRGKPRIKIAGRSEYAYRVRWQIAHHAVPKGAVIDHPCSDPRCVNPYPHDYPPPTPPA